MKLGDKQSMLHELMRGVPEGTVIHQQLEGLCLSELDKLEPLIDALVRRQMFAFGQYIFTHVLTTEEAIAVYYRLKAQGRLSEKTIQQHEVAGRPA